MLKIGDKAPEFNLPNDSGVLSSLSHMLGKNVILYFYPKDDTPGCTLESCGFRDHYDLFQHYDTEIIGLSRDSVSSHKRFREKYDLPFNLLSDEKGILCRSYGVTEDDEDAATAKMARSTFLIDKKGIIQGIWSNVTVVGHINAVLDHVKQLKAS